MNEQNKTPAEFSAPALSVVAGSVLWYDAAEKPATRSDGDCEGQIWTWREYFSPDPETEELKSVGFLVKRHGWREASLGWYHRNRGKLLWTHSDLKQMPPPSVEASPE